MNYLTADAFNQDDNLLPQYDTFIKYHTPPVTGQGKWALIFNVNLQDNPDAVDEADRSFNRLIMTALVYDGSSDADQSIGLLNLSCLVDYNHELHTMISLTPFGGNVDPRIVMSFKIFFKKTDNKQTVEYNVQLWGAPLEFNKVMQLKPLIFDTVRPIKNIYNRTVNSATSLYTKMQLLFKKMNDPLITDTELATKTTGYENLLPPIIHSQTFVGQTSFDIWPETTVLNLSSTGENKVINKIYPSGPGAVNGRKIILICWNSVILKHGGNLDDTDTNFFVLKNNLDYQMQKNETVTLMYYTDKWLQI